MCIIRYSLTSLVHIGRTLHSPNQRILPLHGCVLHQLIVTVVICRIGHTIPQGSVLVGLHAHRVSKVSAVIHYAGHNRNISVVKTGLARAIPVHQRHLSQLARLVLAPSKHLATIGQSHGVFASGRKCGHHPRHIAGFGHNSVIFIYSLVLIVAIAIRGRKRQLTVGIRTKGINRALNNRSKDGRIRQNRPLSPQDGSVILARSHAHCICNVNSLVIY